MDKHSRSSRPEGRGRVVWVDLLRLVMTFQMVQGHCLDAVLASSRRTGPFFDGWTWARGLTSVGFLFAAGVAFHLATLVRFEKHKRDPVAVRRRVRRGLQLVAVGYLLHSPVGVLSGDLDVARRALAGFVIIDVLQCIGFSILILEGLTLLCRRAWFVTAAAASLAVAAIALAPWLESVEAAGVDAVLFNWITPRGGSIFPLVPWAGYLFAGVACAAVVTPRGAQSSPRRGAVWLLGLGGLLAAVAWFGGHRSWGLFASPYPHGATSPTIGLMKLGVVMLLTGGLAIAGSMLSRLPRLLHALAQETLAIYVFHIMLLYGAGYGLSELIGPRLPLVPALGLVLCVLVTSVAVGLGWHRLKSKLPAGSPLLARRATTE